jgi:hypothetical protein
MPVIILNKDFIQQMKVEQILREKYAPIWKNENKRVEVHTPFRTNPIIYFNDELQQPYIRLYLKIEGNRLSMAQIVPMKEYTDDGFTKMRPPN